MPQISDVFIIDVSGKINYRNTKHCVCISLSENKYLLVNTNHREMYDDFQIRSSEYDFLGGMDRFISCHRIHEFSFDRIIKKVGNLNYDDIAKIVDKIQKSRTLDKIDKDSVIPDLDKWLSDNSSQ